MSSCETKKDCGIARGIKNMFGSRRTDRECAEAVENVLVDHLVRRDEVCLPLRLRVGGHPRARKLGAADNRNADRKCCWRSGHWRLFLCERFLGRPFEPIITRGHRVRIVLREGHMSKKKMLAVFVVLIAHLLAFQSAQAFPDWPIKWSSRRPQADLRMSWRDSVGQDVRYARTACDRGEPCRSRRHDRSQIGRSRGAGRLYPGDGRRARC